MAPLLSDEESALDPYALLQLEGSASDKDVQRAYRKLSLKYHPDRNSTPEAAVMFRKISLSLEILLDVAKRSYVDNKLDGDRRRKEKNAAMDKRRRDMVDALVAREEEAKKARLDAVQRRKDAAEEEEIKEAGKRMLEEAQKRAMEAEAAARAIQKASMSSMPTITAMDLTLILQFPSTSSIASSSSSVETALSSRYGPISHVLMKDPPADGEKKKKKGKSKKAVVEFKEGNWGGCWACWKDHADDSSRGIEEGVKAKWATGETPEWVEWASKQPTTRTESNGHSNGHAHRPDLPSFGSAPDFGTTTMEELLADNAKRKSDKIEAKRKDDEFESMTLLKMRQMERQRLEEEIRRQEEEEE